MSARVYMSGFGNEFATEAHPGGLPIGQNAPQKGAARSLYRADVGEPVHRAAPPESPHLDVQNSTVRDASALHAHRERDGAGHAVNEIETTPSQLRWDPMPMPTKPTDWIDGLTTLAATATSACTPAAPFIYVANKSMTDRFFYTADGELLFVPQRAHWCCTPSSGS